jgi:hypothetical protein
MTLKCTTSTIDHSKATVTILFEGLMTFCVDSNCTQCQVSILRHFVEESVDPLVDIKVIDHHLSLILLKTTGNPPSVEIVDFGLRAACGIEVRIKGARPRVSIYTGDSAGPEDFSNVVDLEGQNFHSEGVTLTAPSLLTPRFRIYNGILYCASLTDIKWDRVDYPGSARTSDGPNPAVGPTKPHPIGQIGDVVGIDFILKEDQNDVVFSELCPNGQEKVFHKKDPARYILIVRNAHPEEVLMDANAFTDFIDYYDVLKDKKDASKKYYLTPSQGSNQNATASSSTAGPPALYPQICNGVLLGNTDEVPEG